MHLKRIRERIYGIIPVSYTHLHMALHTLYMHRSHTLYLTAAVLSTWQDKLQVFAPFLLYVLLICHRLKQQAYIQTLSKSTPAGAGAGVVLQRSMILPAFLDVYKRQQWKWALILAH